MQCAPPSNLDTPGRPANAPEAEAPHALAHAGVIATEESAQRVALWMEQTLAAQVEALKKLTEALQAATDALLGTQDPKRVLELRDTLLSVVLEALARLQGETLDAWCALQRDLARYTVRHAGSAAEDLMEPAWWLCSPRSPRTEPAPHGRHAPDAADTAFKTWQRLWLPWMLGAEAAS